MPPGSPIARLHLALTTQTPLGGMGPGKSKDFRAQSGTGTQVCHSTCGLDGVISLHASGWGQQTPGLCVVTVEKTRPCLVHSGPR